VNTNIRLIVPPRGPDESISLGQDDKQLVVGMACFTFGGGSQIFIKPHTYDIPTTIRIAFDESKPAIRLEPHIDKLDTDKSLCAMDVITATVVGTLLPALIQLATGLPVAGLGAVVAVGAPIAIENLADSLIEAKIRTVLGNFHPEFPK
jgi:hypothetical protein